MALFALKLQSGTLKLLDIKGFFWSIGTHYYVNGHHDEYEKFIKECQHPHNNIYVIGEAFSRNQGWVEGALESCHKVIES